MEPEAPQSLKENPRGPESHETEDYPLSNVEGHLSQDQRSNCMPTFNAAFTTLCGPLFAASNLVTLHTCVTFRVTLSYDSSQDMVCNN